MYDVLTVYALLIRESLALLGLVPVQDQTVPERQRRSSIRSRLITVEQRTCKCSLNMAHSLLLELIRRGEGLGHLYGCQYSTPRVHPKATPQRRKLRNHSIALTNFLHASRWGSGILASTLLMSPGPKPVTVRLCLGLLKAGPTGPLRSESGALVEGLRSRGEGAAAAMFSTSIAEKRELLREYRCCRGEGGIAGRSVEREVSRARNRTERSGEVRARVYASL